jgi:WD40 repeat protein
MNRFRAFLVFSIGFLVVFVSTGRGEPPGPEVAKDRFGGPLPEGAVARLGTLRFWHGRTINSVAFSPDGKSIVSGSQGIYLWDVATGKKRCDFSGHSSRVRSVDFTSDGKTLIGADSSSDAVYFWDLTTEGRTRHVGELPNGEENRSNDPANEVRHVAVAPDGKTPATTQGGLFLWDIATGKKRSELKSDGAQIDNTCATFLPDGLSLAADDSSGRVRIWNIKTERPGLILEGHKDSVLCLAYSPVGKMLASAGKDGRVCLWECSTGKLLRAIDADKQSIRSLVITADGKSILAASKDRIRLWNAVTGKEVRCFTGQLGDFNSVAMSPDGKVLASGGRGGVVRLWDVATGKPVIPFDGHDGLVRALAFSPDGKELVSGNSRETILWDVKNRKVSRRIGEEGTKSDFLSYSADGQKLVTSNSDKLCVWQPFTGKELIRITFREDPSRATVLSANGKSIVTRHDSDLCRVWDAETGEKIREFGDRIKANDDRGRNLFLLSPDGTLAIIGGWNAPTMLWASKDGRFVRQLDKAADSGLAGALSPDGSLLAVVAVASDDVILFEVATGKEIRRMKNPKRWALVLAFSPDGRTLASAGGDEEILLWEVSTGKERRRFRAQQPEYEGIKCLAFSPRGNMLASAGDDPTILLWDVTSDTSDLSDKDLATTWTNLMDGDPSQAYPGMCRFMKSPALSVPFLKEHLVPVPHADAKKIDRLIADLDSDEFEVRDRASRELAKFGERTGPALNALLKAKPSAETRRRAEELLARVQGAESSAERLREVRAVEILEHIGTADALRILKSLSDGAPEARLTREAKSSLERLAR